MSSYTLPLLLLFLGGLSVAISAPLREVNMGLSYSLFYLGYIIDAIAIALAVRIWLKSR